MTSHLSGGEPKSVTEGTRPSGDRPKGGEDRHGLVEPRQGERNLYWVTDGIYQSAFLATRGGVVDLGTGSQVHP